MLMSEHEVNDIEAKLTDKANFLSENVQLSIAVYEDEFTSYMGEVLADELKKIVDDRVGKLGLKKRDQIKELKEPVSEY